LVEALAGSERQVFWLDSPDAPEPLPPLEDERSSELAVVGGGFTGLWTALLAAKRGEDVALIEGDRCDWGAGGRNASTSAAAVADPRCGCLTALAPGSTVSV
jgi:2-polyprenyl-6-methoxyphenol hydroxylase-like FAD-dependent oxidoreductase